MHCTYMTTEAMTTAHVEMFRLCMCKSNCSEVYRVQVSSDELLLKLYLSSNHKPYNFCPPQDVLLPESVSLR